MMNASRQTANDANSTGVSMYLSFDSSMSSAAFRTLEATSNDVSVLSNGADSGDETAENSHVDCHQDSTLEAENHLHTSYLRSVKKMEEALSPLRAFPSNILQENRAACSTPAKEQLLQSRIAARSSNVEQCFEIETKTLLPEKQEDDKENTLPLNEKVSSSTMSVEIVSTVNKECDRKLTTIEEVCVHEVTQQQLAIGESVAFKEADVTTKATIPDTIKDKTDTTEVSTTGPPQQITFGRNNIRRTVCEPNLQTNRPSRIVPKRSSLTNVVSKPKAEADQEIMADIPKLLDKMLKISNNTNTTDAKKMPAPVNNVRGRQSVVGVGAAKNRPSMLPAPQAEKRPFNFTQRMSVVVKTTLNSPARKIARTGQIMRRSMLPTRSDTNTARRSMLPANKVVIAPAPKPDATKQKIGQRKPMYPTQEKQPSSIFQGAPSKLEQIFACPMCDAKFRIKSLMEAHKLTHANDPPPVPRPLAPSKPEMPYVCGVCDAKFRIKSLLEAHKRSHEDGPVAFVRKPVNSVAFSGTANSLDNAENKCKFCDKKFALVRALHIHLLQNCPKIPPSEKRKLEFTEMNHVEKAQLPMFFHPNNSGNNAKIAPPPRSRSNLSNFSTSSAESAGEKVPADVTMIPKPMSGGGDSVAMQMAPPSVNKVKKNTAHSGVYRTPNKSIICHICNKSFKNVMDHIQHNMAVHFNQPNIDFNCTDAGLPKELHKTNKSIE